MGGAKTSTATFDVEDYERFVHVQAEAAIRHVASEYPYHHVEDEGPKLHRVLERWATDEMRSLNSQIDFLLVDAARKAGRWNDGLSSQDRAEEDH